MHRMTQPPSPLTSRQRACFDFIRRFGADYGYTPSLDEIRMALGLESKAAAQRLLAALERCGRIRLLPRGPRPIEALSAGLRRTGRTLPFARLSDVASKISGDREVTSVSDQALGR